MIGVRRSLIIVIVAVLCGAWPATGGAQTPAPADAPTQLVTITAGYEAHRDRFHYTFRNPSNIDTDTLVPHSFTQTYVADNQWLVAAVRFPFGGEHMETEVAFTPERQTLGWDLDTFYDPHNDVVVSGTAGEVLMRSWRIAYWSEGELRGLPWRVGYAVRRDRSQFLPTDRILTHSNPPSEHRTPTFGHETTFSTAHEIPIDLSRPTTVSSRWTVVFGADVSPLIWARLTTLLPDKYPGQRIVFDAKALGAGGRMQLVRRAGSWPLMLTVHYGRTWSYSSARQFSREALTVSARVGFER